MSELSTPELFDRYFAVLPAKTPELLDAAYALRYQVYCVEHPFENPLEHPNGREIDKYDAHSVHAVLIYKPTGGVVGCVRLIVPPAGGSMASLPIRALLNNEGRARLDACDPLRTAEISRYAVSKALRRRQGEDLYPDVAQITNTEVRRVAPHISLGLFRAIAELAAAQGITKVCAAMTPALSRLLERFGATFEPLGPPIDYHGLRQPGLATSGALLEGLANNSEDYYRVVDAAYRPVLR